MRKILVLSLVLALALTLVLPSVAMAANPTFYAAGSILTISEGNADTPEVVLQSGASDKWRVTDREITGAFAEGGSITGAYTLVYDGVFDLDLSEIMAGNLAGSQYQEGNFHGIMTSGASKFNVNGHVEPMGFVGTDYGTLPQLTITGHWTYLEGGKGSGNFSAGFVFIPTPDMHIGSIVSGGLEMTSK